MIESLKPAKTAILYTRESEESEAYGGFGLDTHHRQGKAYAARHGLTIIDTLVDIVSGTMPIRQRECGKRLYEYLNGTRKADAVIFPRLDRATRDEEAVEILQLRSDVRRAGMELHYVDRGKADLSLWGGIVDYIIGIKAAEEREELVRKTSEARVDRALAGNTLVGGRPPYGYRCITVSRTPSQKGTQRLEVDLNEAIIVHLIFEWFTIGLASWDAVSQREARQQLTRNQIARRLTELGIPTRADTQPHYQTKHHLGWDRSVVRMILRNPTYATGVWTYRKRKVIAPKWVDRTLPPNLRPPEQRHHYADYPADQQIQVPVPVLLDQVGQRHFEMAQIILAQPPDYHPNSSYLLKGLCTCDQCGRNLVGHSDHGSVIYKCAGLKDAIYRKPKCKSSQFSGTVLEAMMWTFARQMLLDSVSIEHSLRQMAKAIPTDRSSMLQRELEELQRRQIQANRERQNYRQMLGRDRMTESEFDVERQRLDYADQQRALRREEIEQHLANLQRTILSIETSQASITRVQRTIEMASLEEQRNYLTTLQLRGQASLEGDEYVLKITAPWLAAAVEMRATRPIPRDQSKARAQVRAKSILTQAQPLMQQGWNKTKIVAHLGTSIHTFNTYLTLDQYAEIRAELGLT